MGLTSSVPGAHGLEDRQRKKSLALAGELLGQCKGAEQEVGPVQNSTKMEYEARALSRAGAPISIFPIVRNAHISVRLH